MVGDKLRDAALVHRNRRSNARIREPEQLDGREPTFEKFRINRTIIRANDDSVGAPRFIAFERTVVAAALFETEIPVGVARKMRQTFQHAATVRRVRFAKNEDSFRRIARLQEARRRRRLSARNFGHWVRSEINGEAARRKRRRSNKWKKQRARKASVLAAF